MGVAATGRQVRISPDSASVIQACPVHADAAMSARSLRLQRRRAQALARLHQPRHAATGGGGGGDGAHAAEGMTDDGEGEGSGEEQMEQRCGSELARREGGRGGLHATCICGW
jgi:hypothetical protein